MWNSTASVFTPLYLVLSVDSSSGCASYRGQEMPRFTKEAETVSMQEEDLNEAAFLFKVATRLLAGGFRAGHWVPGFVLCSLSGAP